MHKYAYVIKIIIIILDVINLSFSQKSQVPDLPCLDSIINLCNIGKLETKTSKLTGMAVPLLENVEEKQAYII